MNLEKPTLDDMWWPSPESLKDLQVEDWDEGFTLSAPDGTACAAWLEYWSCSEEHQEVFNEAFVTMLQAHIHTLENQHGENEELPDGQNDYRVETQEECSGVFP
jgi:hypothetical protein